MSAAGLLHVEKAAETGDDGLTLSALMHNEIYFLQAFLDHYRGLGVSHFALLDDASDDGSREFARAQPDVTLLTSPHRYADMLPGPNGEPEKAKMLWRRELLARWGLNKWTLHVDLDEFINLPDDMNFPQLADRLERSHKDTAYGAMVDLYPGNLTDFDRSTGSLAGDLALDWFFDAVPHVIAHPFGAPAEVYGGTRGRLSVQYGLPVKPSPLGKRLVNLVFGNSAPFLHRVRKAVFLKWSGDRRLRNEHTISPAQIAPMILPVRHYKFTPSLAQKVDYALDSGAYAKNSGQYRILDDLVDTMKQAGGSFLGPTSCRYEGFDSLKRAGIARGF